jgi:hypothetical protein
MIKLWEEYNQKYPNLVDTYSPDQARNILTKLKKIATKKANVQYEMYRPYIDKYGFVIWGDYYPDSKTLYGHF